jgi:hypothetical protein
MFDYKLIGSACAEPSPRPWRVHRRPVNDDARSRDRASRPIGRVRESRRPGSTQPPLSDLADLSDLYVGELARDVRWHPGAADTDPRREALLLVPPAAALNRREKPQMLSVSEDAHCELPESDYRQEQTQLHDCDNETETMKSIVLRFRGKQ